MDIADQAQQLTEDRLEQSLRNRSTLTIPFSGFCMSCKEPLHTERRFCDSHCREDWEKSRKQNQASTRIV